MFDTSLDLNPNFIPSLMFYSLVWEGSQDWIARVSNSFCHPWPRPNTVYSNFRNLLRREVGWFRPLIIVWTKSACFKRKLLHCPLVSGISVLQIGHFWLFLKLFVQLDNRFTTKLPKGDDRLTNVIKTKKKITILVFLALQKLNITSDGLSGS